MKNKIFILVCCILAFTLTACGSNPKLKNGEEVVASVDGKKFTADELYKELKKGGGPGMDSLLNMIDIYIANKEIETTKDAEDYTQDTVDYFVALAEMYQMELPDFLSQFVGIYGVNNEKEFYDYVLNDYKVTQAIKKHIGSSFTDKDIEQYYDEYYSEKITARHILIKIEESDKDGTKALATANKVIDELKKTDKEEVENKFAELAKEYSEDNSYADGGLLTPFMSSTVVPEFWEASFKLKDGEYTTKPVKTKHGYHIIYRKSMADKPKLADSKEEIKEAMINKTLNTDEYGSMRAMVELRKKYNLKIYDKDIKKQYEQLLDRLDTTQ